LKLKLGAGKEARLDFLNVDIRLKPRINLIVDVNYLHFNLGSFTEIQAIDLLEHLSNVDGKRLLRKCFNWLQPNGSLLLHIPNMKHLASIINDHEALRWIYGSDGEGDTNHPYGYHRWGYTEHSLRKLLESIGFNYIHINEDCLGFGLNVVAVKKK